MSLLSQREGRDERDIILILKKFWSSPRVGIITDNYYELLSNVIINLNFREPICVFTSS